MDDQTHGETAEGAGTDEPLKRDRKALRRGSGSKWRRSERADRQQSATPPDSAVDPDEIEVPQPHLYSTDPRTPASQRPAPREPAHEVQAPEEPAPEEPAPEEPAPENSVSQEPGTQEPPLQESAPLESERPEPVPPRPFLPQPLPPLATPPQPTEGEVPAPHDPEPEASELSPAEELFADAWSPSTEPTIEPSSNLPVEPPTESLGEAHVDEPGFSQFSPPAFTAPPPAQEKPPVVPEGGSPPPLVAAPESPAVDVPVVGGAQFSWSTMGKMPGSEGFDDDNRDGTGHDVGLDRGVPNPSENDSAPPDPNDPSPPAPYVPVGGFAGPGHPRLGPIAPVPAPSHRAIAGLDVAALVTAVLLPPIGFITAIVAMITGKRVRGWASDLARAAIGVSVVMSVVFAGVGGYFWFTETENHQELAALKADQRAHDLVEKTSLPFCSVLAENPAVYSTADPDYGWPAVDAPEGYGAAIAAYAVIWEQLATVAPPGVADEVAAVSERVAGVVELANALGIANRSGDLLGLHEKDDLATVESWYVEYCSAPPLSAESEPEESASAP